MAYSLDYLDLSLVSNFLIVALRFIKIWELLIFNKMPLIKKIFVAIILSGTINLL